MTEKQPGNEEKSYYDVGNTELATETPLTVKRLEAVCLDGTHALPTYLLSQQARNSLTHAPPQLTLQLSYDIIIIIPETQTHQKPHALGHCLGGSPSTRKILCRSQAPLLSQLVGLQVPHL